MIIYKNGRVAAYRMSVAEAEEMLQNRLDDPDLKRIPLSDGGFFIARSDSQELGGTEVDERFAEMWGVKECENYVSGNGDFLIVAKATND